MEQDQKYSQAFLNEDRSRELINVVVAFAVLETFFMLLFLASRTMNHTANGWDVYLMIPAYLFCFSHIIIAALMVQYGGAGRHTAALEPKILVRWLKLDVAEEFIYNFSIFFPKLSILFLYARIFSTRNYRFAIWTIGSIVILTCLSGQIMGVAICRPFSYVWDKSDSNGHCGNLAAAYRYISVPNLLTDICILILPLHGVWHLQTKRIHKIGLTATFLLGCVGMVTGIVRLVYFFQIDLFADVTFNSVGTMTWTLIEPGVYLIAATLPSLRPLIRYFFKGVTLKALYDNLQYCYTRVFPTQKNSKGSTANMQFSSKNKCATTVIADNGVRSAGFVRIDEGKVMSPGVSKGSQEDTELGSW